MFLIGARILSGTVSAEQAGRGLCALADVLVRALHRAGAGQLRAAAWHDCRRADARSLALGKLGGREMTAASDLDLILLYDFDENSRSPTARGRSTAAQYFARLTQRLISALIGADQRRRALSGRHAAAPVRPLRAARHAARMLRGLPGERGLDLGAHGAHARARRRRRSPALCRARREGRSATCCGRRATAEADRAATSSRCARDRRRRRATRSAGT